MDFDPQVGQQLGGCERLGHVVVGAAVEAGDLVGYGVARGEQQHRHADAFAAQLGHHGEAVHLRQHHVEDDHVVVAAFGVGEAGGAVVHDVRLVAVLGEYVRQRLRQAHVVFNDEDLHGDLLSFARPSFHCTVRPEKRLKETGEGPFRERAASARALRRRQALSGNFQAARLGCGV